MRSAVVFNPAKLDDPADLRAVSAKALGKAGWPAPEWFETTVEDPGRGQSRAAVEAGAEMVFACGGDGTIMACASGLVGTEAALAVLPSGTGNLLAANLGLVQRPAHRHRGRRSRVAGAGSTWGWSRAAKRSATSP